MKMLSCKMMGATDCTYEAKGETEEAVINDMMEHAKQHHADMMKDMDMDQMKNMMKEKIQSV